MKSNTEMIYDDVQDRWIIHLNGRTFSLHCGECFKLNIGSMMIPCRIEIDIHWYVMIGEARLNLRPQDIYRVVI